MNDNDFEKYREWAERCARHFCLYKSIPKHHQDDVKQAALLGLLEAIRRFSDGPVPFKTFARTRIFGSMIDEFRLLRNQVWIPVIAERLGVSHSYMALDDHHIMPESQHSIEIEEEASRFLTKLNTREAEIIRLLKADVFQRQIGAMMEVTETRICQILAVLIAKAKIRWRE